MDTSYLTSSDFWQDDVSLVMVNHRDQRAVREAELVRRWLGGCDRLAGHLLFATSGSTGAGKWVALSKSALLVSAQAVNDHFKVTAEDLWMLSLPTFHVGGLGVCARAFKAGCMLTEYQGKWDADRFYNQLASDQATLVSLVPTQLVDLVRGGRRCPERLRAVLVGGGQLQESVYCQAVELGWPVVETYGMTESSSQIATARLGERSLNVLPIWQVKVDESERLMIQGEALMSGYVRCVDDQIQFDPVAQDAWCLTGDVVSINGSVLQVKGRADRCVKILGELVHLDRVVSYWAGKIGSNEGVEIVAMDHERKGVSLCLVVESNSLTCDGLASYNQQCNPLWRVDSVATVGPFPRTSLGKIRYSRLLGMVEDSLKS